jgi:hypothetical protein
MVSQWLSTIPGSTRYVEGNLLYLGAEQFEDLGRFDLIWCLGVLYHNAEQLRLLRKLRLLSAPDAVTVIETEINPSRKPIVQIYWPKPFGGIQTMTHIPSAKAVEAWMEMAGFSDVKRARILSRVTSRRRGVFTGRAAGLPYRSYAKTGLNPEYVVGDST